MKYFTKLFFLTLFFLSCRRKDETLIPAPIPPIVNQDSLDCVKIWRTFVLPRDTMTVQLQMGKPVEIENEGNILKISLIDINDVCSQQDAPYTDFCDGSVSFKVQLRGPLYYNRGDCSYNITSRINRSYANTGIRIDSQGCKINSDEDIFHSKSSPLSVTYKTLIMLGNLSPFTKTTKELIEMQYHKEQYTVTLYLIKRC